MTLIYLYTLQLFVISVVLALRPGPPEVLGPVTVESRTIIATGIGTDETSSIPTGGAPLILGHDVTAEQEVTGEGPSGQSGRDLIHIVDIILPSPPAIISRTHSCMQAIWVDNIIPGATVIAQVGGSVLAFIVADSSPIWLALDPTVPRNEGDVITISHSITYTSGRFDAITFTDPLQSFRTFMNGRERGLSVKQPLKACTSQLEFTWATPGSLTTRTTGTFSGSSWAPDFQFTLDLAQPLDETIDRTSFVHLRESLLSSCKLLDIEQGFIVERADAVHPPTLDIKPCFDSQKVRFGNLFRHGTLFISRNDADGEDIRRWPIGDTTSDEFDLPQDWRLFGADFSFWQTDPCNHQPSSKMLSVG